VEGTIRGNVDSVSEFKTRLVKVPYESALA